MIIKIINNNDDINQNIYKIIFIHINTILQYLIIYLQNKALKVRFYLQNTVTMHYVALGREGLLSFHNCVFGLYFWIVEAKCSVTCWSNATIQGT